MSDLKDILVNIGAIAGFAGIVGLAVLAMLYFSQARDVRRLREWAGREPERAAEIELRAQQMASQAIAQAYESMAVRQAEAEAAAGIAEEQGVEVPAPVVATDAGAETAAEIVEHGAEEGAAEAGAAAAEGELGAASAEESGQLHQPTEQFDVLAAAAEETAEAETAEAVSAAEGDAALEPAAASANGQAAAEGAVETPAGAAHEPAAAEASGSSRLAPSTPAAARASAPLPPLPPLDTSEFRAVGKPPTPPVPDYYLASEATGSGRFEAIDPSDAGRRSRVPFAVAGVLVAVFAVVLIATQIGGGGGSASSTRDKTAARAARDSRATSTGRRNPQVNRPAVNVSVLNGTQTPGLAKLVGDRLVQAGFTSTTEGNRNDGINHVTSTVYYASGSKLEAHEVARELGIKDLKPADEETLAAGGSVPVIVVLGADQEQ